MLMEINRKKWVSIYLYLIICSVHFACTSKEVAESPNELVVKEEQVLIDKPSKDKVQKDLDLAYQDSLTENPKIDIISSEPDQTSWKIPNVVIHKMGDLKGQTIADIGAGVGYFAFRLVLRGANVIAIDIDPSSIDLMNSISLLNLDNDQKSRFETRLAKPDDPLLKNDEVDKAILMHLIGFIDDKREYLVNLKNAIKKGGQLMIMDFKMKRLPAGYPSKDYRMYSDQLEDLLYDVGYENVLIDDTTLEFQYILTAINPD